jgi:hypothetical protein
VSQRKFRTVLSLTGSVATAIAKDGWLTQGWWLTGMDKPKTIHDFGGFPQERAPTTWMPGRAWHDSMRAYSTFAIDSQT